MGTSNSRAQRKRSWFMYAPLSANWSKDRTKKGGIGRRPTPDLEGRRVAACFHDAAQENGDVFYLAFGED